MARFTLRATLSDGFTVALDGAYATQAQADRAAGNYIRDYSDPCGLGLHVVSVSVIDMYAGFTVPFEGR